MDALSLLAHSGAGIEPVGGLSGWQAAVDFAGYGAEHIVLGYRGEPMIRMSATGVEVNRRSPSAYLSGDRYAAINIPRIADPAAPPLEAAGQSRPDLMV